MSLLRLIVACSLLACSANHTVTSSTASSPPAPPPSAADDFLLRIEDYHWEVGGYEFTFVNADGSAEHIDFERVIPKVGMPRPEWRRRRFQVSADTLTGLQQLLASARFVELDPLYVNPDIHDGANTSYIWNANGVTKKVHCSNKYPDAVRELRSYVRAKIIDTIPRTARYEPLTHQQMRALSSDPH
jgi:hypothetical protein